MPCLSSLFMMSNCFLEDDLMMFSASWLAAVRNLLILISLSFHFDLDCLSMRI